MIDESDMAFFFTTTMRFHSALNTIVRIRMLYPRAKIYLADQDDPSEDKNRAYIKNRVEFFYLENDCGLSFARNFLIGKIKEKYCVLIDDDLLIDSVEGLNLSIDFLESHPEIDIVGGYFWNVFYDEKNNQRREVYLKYNYRLELDQDARVLHCISEKYFNAEATLYRGVLMPALDVVHNYAVIRMSFFKKTGILWDERMKITGEHVDFYLRVKQFGGVGIVFNPLMRGVNNKVYSSEFLKLRKRTVGLQYFFKKWSVDYIYYHEGKVVCYNKKHAVNIKPRKVCACEI